MLKYTLLRYFLKNDFFQHCAPTDLPLDYYSTQNVTSNTVRDAIRSMKYTGGYSSLGLIIGMVSQLYNFDNMNSRKVLVLVTDGWSVDDFTFATRAMGQAGVTILPIGLSSSFALKGDALQMLTLFDNRNVLKSEEWNNVARLRHEVMDRICSVDPIETMRRAYDIELPELDDEYLQLSRVNDLQGFFREQYSLTDLKNILNFN